ncbi:hypothetical protein JCM9279_003454 [Rhodotorula babjevae]
MPPIAPATRKPRFTIDDSQESSESEPEHEQEHPRERARPRTRRVPAIVVEDAGQAPSSREDSPAGARDLDREEKHVGFAAGPDLVTVGGGGGSDEESARADEAAGGEGARAAGYPPAPRRASSDTTSHRHGESSDETATAPPHKNEVEGKGFDRPEFAQPPKTTPPALKRKLPPLPGFLAWVKPHLNWKGLRPVIRASVASWCGLLLMLCTSSLNMLGQAAFLVLVVSVISPAASPIAAQLETTFFQFLLVAVSWAWACIVIAIAHASRTTYSFSKAEFQAYAAQRYAQAGMSAAQVQTAVQEGVFHGDFLEPGASAVCAIFLGVGCGFFLWLRGYVGPGPVIFGCIFAMILLIVCLTIAVLFPYPYYSIGLVFFLPFTCQQAITLAATFLIFPETLAHQFADRLIAVLGPMHTVVKDQKRMLAANPRSAEWLQFKSIQANANAANGIVGLMTASEANLSREISFARVSGRDLSAMLQNLRILVARTSGFAFFHAVVEKHLHREESDAKGGPAADDLVLHLGHSRANSRDHTPSSTRPSSPTRERREASSAADPAALGEALSRIRLESEPRSGQAHGASSSPAYPSSPLSPAPDGAQNHPPRIGRAQSSPGLRARDKSSASLADLAEHPSTSTHDRDEHASVSIAHGAHPHHHSHHPEPHSPHAQGHYTRFPREKRRRSRSKNRSSPHGHGHGKNSSSHISLPSLLHDVLHPQLDVKPVGVVESMTYADLEDYLHNPRDEEHLEELMRLLSKASGDLLGALDKSISHLVTVIHRFKSLDDTWRALVRYDDDEVEKLVKASRSQLDELKAALVLYRDDKRLEVVRPFARLFDPFGAEVRGEVGDDEMKSQPSHRGLFWAFQYEHALLGWGEALVDLFETVLKVESKRRRPRVWWPNWRRARFTRASGTDEYDEDDPQELRDLNTSAFSAPRNPDSAPPKNLAQFVGVKVTGFFDLLARRDVLFGIKSAILLGLCSLPAMFPSTSYFFQKNRGVWVLVMITLTSNQFLGDVTFGYLVRVFGTIGGAAVGLLLWSIAAQTGKGHPVAVGAVCAVAWPVIFFWRVHMQPVMTALLPAVTTMLVIGYSWQDAHNPSLSTVGYGWDVAWKRLVCVMIGISIAFVWALVPPSTRQKVTIRLAYAKVIGRMGDVLCQVLSYANCKDGPTRTPKNIVKNLAALRMRVNRTVQARAMARYELSLQGDWPSDLYASLQALQMEMLDQLGQFCAVTAKLDAKWTKALLHRTQFANPRFLQDVLTTLYLISSALEHGTPLPWIYNPLLERFLKSPEVLASGHQYGYEVQLGDDDVAEGLPKHVNLETICSLDYLRFSAGVSQAYAVVNRLDRLMLVAKSLVGENYLLYGLDTHRGHHGRDEEAQALLDEHFHGPDSRRTSFDHDSDA